RSRNYKIFLRSLILFYESVMKPGALLAFGSWFIGVSLVLASVGAASQIATRPWARSLHVAINGVLFFAFAAVSYSGWTVVQQYLP
ncbi:MAG: DUF4079 family protein, partial [Cyanobacteria bacterium J06633_23]